ncbi:unnamed protein product [Chironomus riparius]|uniref:Ribosomal protein mS38 C-terminal domain-containing protein n=1 Tax=Chironomus riparius TaxID=315576 RepID=A0A9N9S2C0_9DIPT|nr:unnamed protein product [Chironomus riparius]
MLFVRQITGISFCTRLITNSCRKYNISTNPARITQNFIPTLLINKNEPNKIVYPLYPQKSHETLINEIGIQRPIWKKEIFEVPITNKVIEMPIQINNKVIEDVPNINKSIELPTESKIRDSIKQAARLIVIRKRKMRKHKLRKLRKKMKFVWAKAKQRREWKKEKRFLNSLLNQIKVAQKFSAEDYVNEMISKATESPPPKYYKKRRMPTWLILEMLEKENQKKLDRKYKFWEECGK